MATFQHLWCTLCGSDKYNGESLIRWPSDWWCLACGKNNWDRNLQCFFCSRARGVKRGPVIEEDVIIKKVKYEDECVIVGELHPVIDLTPMAVQVANDVIEIYDSDDDSLPDVLGDGDNDIIIINESDDEDL